MKKYFTIGTLVCLGVTTIMLILSLFGISFFEGVKLSLLITFACLTVGGYFAISGIQVLNKNKTLGYISLTLIAFAVVLVMLTGWVNFGKLLSNITLTIALLSVIFNFITSNTLKLGKKFIAVQVVCDIVLCVFIVLCLMLAYGVYKINTLFWLLLILSVVAFIVMNVLAGKNFGEKLELSEGYVKIAKAEYEDLLAKARILEQMQNNKEN